MKRGAERQLTKDGPGDDDDDDDIEEIDPLGFRKADDAVLAKRQMRALPKRALATSRPPPLNGVSLAPTPDAETVEAVPPPKFGGFAGFGSGTSPSNPFTFTAQPLPTSLSQLSSTFNPTPVSSFFGAPTPPALNAGASPPKPATSPPADRADGAAFKYFKSLRGLNVSFLSAISTAVEKDPFVDVASLVESYKNLRTTIQSEFDGSPQPFAVPTTNSTPIFGASTISPSMPKPPVGSAESFSKLSTTGESGTKTSGFTFPPFIPPPSSVPSQLPFGAASRPTETPPSTILPDPPKPAFAFPVPTSGTPPGSGFSFTSTSSIENSSLKSALRSSSQEIEGLPTSAPSSSRTSPSFGSSNMPSFFANSKPTNVFGSSDATSKPMSVFGGSIFGGSSTTESNKPSLFTSPSSENKDTSKVNIPLFGNVTSSSVSTSVFGSSSDKPANSFGSASPPKTSAFTFGKPGGSIGNPVGFGFGSSSPSAGDTTIAGSSGPGFNFGISLTKPTESLFSPPTTDKSTESTPQPDEELGEDDPTRLLTLQTHDEEGEGEEDEETTHVVRCKVFRLSKSEGKSEWKDLGVGMFRLKKHKVTNVRRALMRNSNTGRILINFRIYGTLKPSLTKTAISFIGYENNMPASFRIRVKTEEQAGELKEALEREIAATQVVE